jgi:hypothetical protein
MSVTLIQRLKEKGLKLSSSFLSFVLSFFRSFVVFTFCRKIISSELEEYVSLASLFKSLYATADDSKNILPTKTAFVLLKITTEKVQNKKLNLPRQKIDLYCKYFQ